MVEHLNLLPEKSQESLTILEWSSILQGNIWSGHSTLRRHPGGVEYLRGLWSQLRCLKKTISGARLTYEELLTVIIEVEMILNCRPLSYVSSEDYEEPLTPSHLLCGHRIMSLPDNRSSEAEDSDTDVQPQDLDRRMSPKQCHEPFLEEMEKGYLLELRNSHRNVTQHSSNRVVSIGDVVIVHDEDQPRGK